MLSSPNSSPLIDVATAREIALSQVEALEEVRDLALGAALGQVCARDIAASVAMPFFTNSAMDGYALRAEDLGGAGGVLPIAGTVAAGAADPQILPRGVALRIFTGAPLPEGADTVVPLEEASEVEGALVLTSRPERGANVRLAGSDQPMGACLVARGTRIAPQHIGLLAANGIGRVPVVRAPRVVVLSTGDELAAPGAARGHAQIHDANRPMLIALAEAAGCEVIDGGILPDEVEPLSRRLADLSAAADLVLSSGGVSLGGRDPFRPAFFAAGGEIAGWRVAVKPGKPIVFGRLGATAFSGLPGNPMAAFVGFHLFASAQIARLSGRAPTPFAAFKARAGFSWRHSPGRQEVFPVRRLGTSATGLPVLERLGIGVSATLFPLAEADGLAVIPAMSEGVARGDILHWHPFCAG